MSLRTIRSQDLETTDESKIRSLYQQMLDGWNHHSADVVADLFTEDGDLVGFDRGQLKGRAEIASVHRQIFTEYPTAAFVGRVSNVRFLTSDVAVLSAVAGMVTAEQSDLDSELNSVQTLVATKRDGQWRIAVFQKYPRAVVPKAQDWARN